MESMESPSKKSPSKGAVSHRFLTFKGQLGVTLTVYPWYLAGVL